MPNNQPADYEHLKRYAQNLFPDGNIEVIYTSDEIIHINVDGHRYTFEIGSDDDAYVFSDGLTSFTIPLMETIESPRKKPDIGAASALIERSFPTIGDD